jgi:hypothetical protein
MAPWCREKRWKATLGDPSNQHVASIRQVREGVKSRRLILAFALLAPVGVAQLMVVSCCVAGRNYAMRGTFRCVQMCEDHGIRIEALLLLTSQQDAQHQTVPAAVRKQKQGGGHAFWGATGAVKIKVSA